MAVGGIVPAADQTLQAGGTASETRITLRVCRGAPSTARVGRTRAPEGTATAYAARGADDESVIRAFSTVTARPDEVAAARPGDDIVPGADVVMDRAFTVDASRESLWPWVIQLGKQRAGWYLPQSVERFMPRSRRAARSLDPAWQGLAVGDVIPDYGDRNETFEVAAISAPSTLVYTREPGRCGFTRPETDVSKI